MIECLTSLAALRALGPLVRSLEAQAQGDAGASKKFILYNHANGFQLSQIRQTTRRSNTDFTLSGCLAPLAEFRSELNILEQFHVTPGSYLHGNQASALSCSNRGSISDAGTGQTTNSVVSETIDQLIARTVSSKDRFHSLALGHPFAMTSGNCAPDKTILGAKNGTLIFPEADPLKAYTKIFSGFVAPTADAATQAEAARQLAIKKSHLDYLRQDIARINAALPSAQKAKLEQYLDSLRALEMRLAPVAATASCSVPSKPSTPAPTRNTNSPELWKIMCDLAVAALSCGQTHQVSLLHSFGCMHMVYQFDGESWNHHEQVCHNKGPAGGEDGAFASKILAFHASNVAYLFKQLKAIKEGSGTLADNTLILWMSDGGGRHHNGSSMHPAVLLGTAGKALRTGNYLTFADGKRPLADVHMTAAKAMGVTLSSFGDGTDPGSGIITELMS